MIELINLTKFYRNLKAVDKLNLKIMPGKIFGFLGPNGAGKTTTIKMIMGLINKTEGEIIINGDKLDIKNIQNIKLKVGYLPEDIFLYDRLKGREFLEFICGVYKVKDSSKKIEYYLDLFQLENDMNKFIEDYSRGMKKKISIISTLIHDPEILILDEPTSGLDPKTIRTLKDILLMKKKEFKTVFFSTHILDIVDYLCDEIGIINKGKLVFTGNLKELRKSRQHFEASLEELFLEMTEK
ncbi:MAG: ABC transporter ATP-binding protein [Elusimicrobiota bacterium]